MYVCPSNLHVALCKDDFAPGISVAPQNCNFGGCGAYTGEMAVDQARAITRARARATARARARALPSPLSLRARASRPLAPVARSRDDVADPTARARARRRSRTWA